MSPANATEQRQVFLVQLSRLPIHLREIAAREYSRITRCDLAVLLEETRKLETKKP